MLVVAVLRYQKPMTEVEKHTEAHRAYMRTLHERGVLVASGPFVPRTGGMLLFKADSRDEVDVLLADDPFLEHDVAVYEVQAWTPTIGKEALEKL